MDVVSGTINLLKFSYTRRDQKPNPKTKLAAMTLTHDLLSRLNEKIMLFYRPQIDE